MADFRRSRDDNRKSRFVRDTSCGRRNSSCGNSNRGSRQDSGNSGFRRNSDNRRDSGSSGFRRDSGRSGFRRNSGSSRFGRDSNGRKDFGRNTKRNNDNRRDFQSTKVTCSDCGNQCEVPFVPKTNKPLLCDACFSSKKPSSQPKASHSERDFDLINEKLNKILKILENRKIPEETKSEDIN